MSRPKPATIGMVSIFGKEGTVAPKPADSGN